MRTHRYAEDYSPNQTWISGYEIISLLPAGNREPQYQIRSDGQTYDQVVWEPQLQEEFGRRVRLSTDAMPTTTIAASPDRRTGHKRNHPKWPGQRQDLTRWDDEGGAPRSGHHFTTASPPQPEAETALSYFNIQTGSRLVEDPEGNKYPDLQAAREVAIAMARNLMVEGDRQGESRQGWQIEIMDRANQLVMTVAFGDVRDPRPVG
ncbi:DUF6894 family protein [Microvirga sp. M2]|uniref:DUF6894 family protein n=1 Tax=Microvirga sp. M2 TaxID=3073270 RepID=UPI0039C05D96